MLDDAAARTRSIVEAHDLTEVARHDRRGSGTRHGTAAAVDPAAPLQEYARHLGHLDIARELVDGRTGEEG